LALRRLAQRRAAKATSTAPRFLGMQALKWPCSPSAWPWADRPAIEAALHTGLEDPVLLSAIVSSGALTTCDAVEVAMRRRGGEGLEPSSRIIGLSSLRVFLVIVGTLYVRNRCSTSDRACWPTGDRRLGRLAGRPRLAQEPVRSIHLLDRSFHIGDEIPPRL